MGEIRIFRTISGDINEFRFSDFTDTSEYWMFPFEIYDFRNEMEKAWDQIKPLYEQLHAYVRRKLRDLYGPEKISREAPLPAHILGRYLICLKMEILEV